MMHVPAENTLYCTKHLSLLIIYSNFSMCPHDFPSSIPQYIFYVLINRLKMTTLFCKIHQNRSSHSYYIVIISFKFWNH